MIHDTLKVCVFVGFLGSGKTTILQRLLPTLPREEKVRIIVNDISRDNIDVHAFQPSGATNSTSARGNDVAALSGGCVCCNLLSDLVAELQSAHAQGCGYSLVECTGVADPVPIVATLHALPELRVCVAVDAVVMVIAASSLLSVTTGDQVALNSLDVLQGDPIKGANVVLINNWEYTDRIDATMMRLWVRRIKEFASESNPHVRVYCTNDGYFAFDSLVYRQGLFAADNVASFFLGAYAAAGQKIGTFGGNAAAEEEAGEMMKLGLRLFTLELRGKVFSTQLLRRALFSPAARQLLKNVWRSKGYFSALDDEGSGGSYPAKEVQFRWQTVERKVDYGEVLPPYVPLVGRESGEPLCCQVVFIGDFDTTAKAQQAAAFFSAVASRSV
ncbi:hypothetical protein LMJF_22_1650 [Leishmania major strain Friedlin]|uniref:CobW/HypB/UreG nucleotide-binding domain-containing protein n=1 Tax=Leishmania major TaxID=5664 RepID=Q4QBI2_LEIMA|nr:hypothetical protein LMJF_22_1650 [Leishmania major strain Friedlin]CAG9574032.1 CobW/HypB/UreG_-_nucleotide-binding_domain_containing_protein_-_putative [Leishmania major strain Friedlin]CAJ04932.1 hypothetical protein LMJF_22_1650 [Leishmania major strain Friedlin]|eukprot:XP_001683316.1 hypothetical protein LMJF_22_1650 [Leishmania major strain Friedlin]